ncbi:MAG TPA: 16S rRNA (guanine(966)-N(2))-methyltransferase RsmD [Burkholderiaceae bacterium]|nr:16S rRNA (guanine(966)-N(2))-methyltransferase RsmD [Burkholderiaceae bacterium]
MKPRTPGKAAAPPGHARPPVAKVKSVAARAPNEVRIVGGRWRRHLLPVLDLPGLRPTPDRVRETLFNWLGQDLSGWSVLDAFAGSGALGFEAASRGAAEVRLLEVEPRLVHSLHATRERLGADTVTITRADALGWMRRAPSMFDLVLLDPPFTADLYEAALAAVRHCLAPEGWVYLEAPREFTAPMLEQTGLSPWRHSRAGAVHAHLLRKTAIKDNEEAPATDPQT